MSKKGFLCPIVTVFSLIILCIFFACNNNAEQPPATDIAKSPQELDVKATDIIESALGYAAGHEGRIDDSIQLVNTRLLQSLYENSDYITLWSSQEQLKPVADSLRNFISDACLYGLFPADYHHSLLDSINRMFLSDTFSRTARRDAVLWAKVDLMMTDAFFQLVSDLKLGRLPQDSITQRKDSVLGDEFYIDRFQLAQQGSSLTSIFQALEPKHAGYHMLKEGLKAFLDSADYKIYTKVPVRKDTINFKQALSQRLFEGGFIGDDSLRVDSVKLAKAIKSFQQSKGITADGKIGDETIRVLNTSDKERFVRIALTLDKYKMLPDSLPWRHVWVNLPGYYMKLIEEDSVLLFSKIICGKEITRTPLLTSAISNMVTYPQWTIPESIIAKEVLPAAKKDPGYFAEKGYSLVNDKGDEVDPYLVDWAKYKKGIPFNVVQGSGDENALGILKFNFPNKYAVYLHDTNQRYLFARNMRSLSHGCVRVQEWEKLAYNIVRFDNVEKYPDTMSPTEDSLTTWLQRKEKHIVPVRKKLPLFIRYFTCEGKGGKIVFYDDIYGEDKALQEKFFAGK
jgi:murein L,D-transpeptidase YcbB/YkuD